MFSFLIVISGCVMKNLLLYNIFTIKISQDYIWTIIIVFVLVELGTQLKEMLLSYGSSEIQKQSVCYIDKLTESVTRQKSTLLHLLSQRKNELKSHGRLATIEQSAEDVR